MCVCVCVCAHVPVFVMMSVYWQIVMPPLPPAAGYLSECVTSAGREGCGDSPVTTAALVRIRVRVCACVSR